MDAKRWELFINEKTIELNRVEIEGGRLTQFAVMWTLINLFRFLLDWHDEWLAAHKEQK